MAEAVQKPQEDNDTINGWTLKNELRLNIEKTKIIIISFLHLNSLLYYNTLHQLSTHAILLDCIKLGNF